MLGSCPEQPVVPPPPPSSCNDYKAPLTATEHDEDHPKHYMKMFIFSLILLIVFGIVVYFVTRKLHERNSPLSYH